MSKKLIGYVRVSSEISKIKGNSINNQINKVNDFCNLNDYQLVDVLKDEGKLLTSSNDASPLLISTSE